jgi:holo-[acyl-carrier protein] synthase
MSVFGLGCDIEETERFKRLIENTHFMNRIFTLGEREYIKKSGLPYLHAAGIFCAKEAFSKAVGTGIRGFGFADIEIAHTKLGNPYLILSKRLKAMFPKLKFTVSISHCKTAAMAAVIAETED